MDVLVLNPPNDPFTEQSLLIEPIDALGIATYVTSLGHDVNVIDMDVQQLPPDAIRGILDRTRPEAVIIPFDYHIPLHKATAKEGVKMIARLAAEKNIRTIIGGKVATHRPLDLLTQKNIVCCRGQMELALRDLLREEALSLEEIPNIAFLEGKTVTLTARSRQAVPFSRLPTPDRHLVNLDDYIDVRTLISSRSCTEHCTFCPVPEFWGRYQLRSAESVLDEIATLTQDHGAKKILFLDNHATASRKRMRDIADGIAARGIDAAFGCLSTIGAYDAATFARMREAGFCWVHYGVEAVDDTVLAAIGKRQDASQVLATLRSTIAQGYRVRTSWIVDAPGTTEATLDRARDALLTVRPHEVRLHYLSILDGTSLARTHGAENDQYIHGGRSRANLSAMTAERVEQKVQEIKEALAREGYVVLEHSIQCRDLPDDPSTRFVATCASRYGVGWRR